MALSGDFAVGEDTANIFQAVDACRATNCLGLKPNVPP
jgi:hypothetical protein